MTDPPAPLLPVLELSKAIDAFQQSEDWSDYKDWEKREMAFLAGVKWAEKNRPTAKPDMPSDDDIERMARAAQNNKKCRVPFDAYTDLTRNQLISDMRAALSVICADGRK